jgi:membrane fusion protein, multidrug efflux system
LAGSVCLLLLAAGWLGGGCTRKALGDSKGGKAGKGPVPVLATQAVEKTMPVELREIGNAQAFSVVAIRSRISGELTRVHFHEGQDVKQGDLLFTIDPRPARAALEQAEANLARDQAQLDNARIEYGRQKQLVQEQLISTNDFDKAEANLKVQQALVLADRAALSNAVLNLEYTEIHSPIAGRTGNLLVHAGNIVQTGSDVLVTVNQWQPMFVAFSVEEKHLAAIKQHMAGGRLAVVAKIAGQEGAPPRGELSFVDNAVDTTTGTIQLKATFANADGALWPGQFIEVLLNLTEQPKAVVVPAQAVQESQTGPFVFVVKSDQTVEMRRVKPGLSREGETVVEQGLAAGETVVTDGHLRLVPGARVNIKPGLATAAPALSSAKAP